MKRIERFVQVTKKPNNYRRFRGTTTNEFFPSVVKGQILEMNLSGVGAELDDRHFVIVWKQSKTRDQILVIPTTSFKDYKTMESGVRFNIGKVAFLNAETVVLLDQVTSLSRKKLLKDRFNNSTNREFEVAVLSPEQIKRVEQGFLILGQSLNTLLTYLIEVVHKSSLPSLVDYDTQIEHLHLPFQLIDYKKDEHVKYKLLSNDEKEYVIKLQLCSKGVTRSLRKQLILNWANALAEYDASNNLVKSRIQVQQEAYIEIQNKFAAGSEREEIEIEEYVK